MFEEMKLEIFNSMFYSEYFLECRTIMKFLECTIFISTNISFSINFFKKGCLPVFITCILSTEFVCQVLESVKGEAFWLKFSIVGLLLCEGNSILEGLSSDVKLDNFCIYRSSE